MNSQQDVQAAIRAALPQRRSQVVAIGARTFRVREPPPTRGFGILAQVIQLLGPTLVKILSGQGTLWQKARCPTCGGSEAQDLGGQWLCIAPTGAQNMRCGQVFDKAQEVDDMGQPVAMTIGALLAHRTWRGAIALQIEQSMNRLDPREATPLMRQILVGNLDMAMGEGWVEVQDLDTRVPNSMALMMLVRAAMEAWILPSVVDDYIATSPGSSTSNSEGGRTEEPGKPSTDGAVPVLPGPQPTATRAPPPVRRQG